MRPSTPQEPSRDVTLPDNAIGQPGYSAVTRVAVTFGVKNVCASLATCPSHHRYFGDGGTWAGASGG